MLIVAFSVLKSGDIITVMSVKTDAPYVIVDAGHGSPDGGASSESGLLEKDINLSIAEKLKDLLKLCGYNVIMTRTGDEAIYDENSATIREKKRSDIKNRVRIATSNPGAVFVSIHQNWFSDKKQNGAQIFYSPNSDGSRLLAERIRARITDMIQPDNKREIKKSDSDIYILQNVDNDAVLVECGFLSNMEEAMLLATDDYQFKLAFAVAAGIADHISEKYRNNPKYQVSRFGKERE